MSVRDSSRVLVSKNQAEAAKANAEAQKRDREAQAELDMSQQTMREANAQRSQEEELQAALEHKKILAETEQMANGHHRVSPPPAAASAPTFPELTDEQKRRATDISYNIWRKDVSSEPYREFFAVHFQTIHKMWEPVSRELRQRGVANMPDEWSELRIQLDVMAADFRTSILPAPEVKPLEAAPSKAAPSDAIAAHSAPCTFTPLHEACAAHLFR